MTSWSDRLRALAAIPATAETAASAHAVETAADAPAVETAASERCDLCGAPLAVRHSHLLESRSGRLLCACPPCGVLFDSTEADGRRLQRITQRLDFVMDFILDDEGWAALAVPVGLAFFVPARGVLPVRACYPSPLGAAEALVDPAAWAPLAAANPIVATCAPGVEALLVRRTTGRNEHWIAGLDECYRLTGLVRRTWRGFSGGKELWSAVDAWFEDLKRRSRTVSRRGSPGDGDPADTPIAAGRRSTHEEPASLRPDAAVEAPSTTDPAHAAHRRMEVGR